MLMVIKLIIEESMVKKAQNYSVELKTILSRYGIKLGKKLGQHFLVDQGVLDRLLDAAELKSGDVVLEVGAGMGVITVELAQQVKKVIAVEKDRNLIPALEQVLQEAGVSHKVEVVNCDILEFGNLPPKVVGAIPYQITSPLIHKFLKRETLPELIVFIIQNEVAEKIVAVPPRACYLSNFIQSLALVELVGKPIPSTAFWPQPKVKSRVIKLKTTPDVVKAQGSKFKSRDEIDKWERFLHRGFRNPRKMLRNEFDEEILLESGIDPQSRPQELMLSQWESLFFLLGSVNND